MIKKLIFFSTLFCALVISKAQPNFSEHVAPIIYNKCSSCHHNGGIAPLAFTSYEEGGSTSKKGFLL